MSLNRRSLLKSAAIAGSFQIVPRRLLGGQGYTPPSEELTRGIIGCGNMGSSHMGYRGSRVLALSDVKKSSLNRGIKRFKGRNQQVDGYHDFREMLARPDIDIVSVVTPPHWHGLMAILAAEAGKDVWCEKPLTRTIAEGQRLKDACRRNGTILRVNTWFRMTSKFYGMGLEVSQIKKAVDSGMLGWPLTVTVGGGQGFSWKHNWKGKPTQVEQPIPNDIDYDMWLGPAPWKPYTNDRTSPNFRGYWDYDGGGLGDMAMHYLDPVQYFLGKDKTSPIKVEVMTDDQHPDAVGPWKRVTLTYADGCKIILDGDNSLSKNAYLQGPKGNIQRGFQSDIPDFHKKLASIPDPVKLNSDFHVSVRTRQKFPLNEINGHRSGTLVNLSKIGLRLNRTLHYDPVKEVFINDDAANRYIDQPMRSHWNLI